MRPYFFRRFYSLPEIEILPSCGRIAEKQSSTQDIAWSKRSQDPHVLVRGRVLEDGLIVLFVMMSMARMSD